MQYSLLQGGMAYVTVTAFPDKIEENSRKTVPNALQVLYRNQVVKQADGATWSDLFTNRIYGFPFHVFHCWKSDSNPVLLF